MGKKNCREKGHFERVIWPFCCAEILKGKGGAQVLIEATLELLGLNQKRKVYQIWWQEQVNRSVCLYVAVCCCFS